MTTNKDKNPGSRRHLRDAVSRTQTDQISGLSQTPVINLLSNEEFERLVRVLGKTALRERFPLEASSFNAMRRRRDAGKCTIQPEFEEFRSFLLHVGQRPHPNWTLDRIHNPTRVYGPGLVRWADPTQQANNRSTTRLLIIDGEIRPIRIWAERSGWPANTIRQRLKRNPLDHKAAVYPNGRRGPNARFIEVSEALDVEDYSWPGSKPELWEAGFQSFVAFAQSHWRLKLHGKEALTRDAFLAWVGRNLLREASAQIRRDCPGYGDPECDEPPEVRDHRYYPLVRTFDEPVRSAWARISGEPAQLGLMRNSLKSVRQPVTPKPPSWAAVFAGWERGD